MASVNASMVTDALIAMLRTEMAPVPVGDGVAPSRTAEDGVTSLIRSGYIVVHRIPSGASYEGSEIGGQPEALERIRYQISAAGIQRNQVERIRDAAIGLVVDRGDSDDRGYVIDLVVAGHVVMSRRKAGVIQTESLGTIQAGGYVDLLVNVD